MAKGIKTGGGNRKGIPNKSTIEFKQALTNLLNYAAPNMIGWLEQIAATDPHKALDHVGKLAEYVQPKLARTEHAGDRDAPIQFAVKWDDGK